MADYLEYLKSTAGDAVKRREQRSANTQAMVAAIQQIKNANAPVISGGAEGSYNVGSSGVGSSSYGGEITGGNAGLLSILKKAGFKGQGLKTAYAVAMAESGGRRTAHNPNAKTGDNSYGLFQINMLGSMGPARRKQYGLKSNEQLFDPLTNAKIAYKMSKGGTNWQPWSAYKNGSYKKHLGALRTTKAPNGQQVVLGPTTSWNGSVGKVTGGKAMPIAGGRWGYAYGSRNKRYASGYHTGWDISTREGTKVRAAAGGVVSSTGFNRGGYGNYVKIKHADGTTSLYAHNSAFKVRAGQRVNPGDVIALSGNTGASSGPHLHFEVRRTDRYGGDVNPRKWLSTR